MAGEKNRRYNHEEIIKLFKQGINQNDIAHRLQCGTATVSAVLLNAGLRERVRVLKSSPLPPAAAPACDPPSPAMLRLAEFDPIIARAVRDRLGLPPQKEEEVFTPS